MIYSSTICYRVRDGQKSIGGYLLYSCRTNGLTARWQTTQRRIAMASSKTKKEDVVVQEVEQKEVPAKTEDMTQAESTHDAVGAKKLERFPKRAA